MLCPGFASDERPGCSCRAARRSRGETASAGAPSQPAAHETNPAPKRRRRCSAVEPPVKPELAPYELARQATIERNHTKLEELGLA